jgi:hypothetical protein
VTLEDLTACEWAIIGFLAGRTWVDAETLNRCTAPASRQHGRAAIRGAQTIRVHVFNIREKLGDGAIIGVVGKGYMLGAPGVRVWRARQAAMSAFAASA